MGCFCWSNFSLDTWKYEIAYPFYILLILFIASADKVSRQSYSARTIAEQGSRFSFPAFFTPEIHVLLCESMTHVFIIWLILKMVCLFTCILGIWQCAENKELQEKLNALEQQLASVGSGKSSLHYEPNVSEEYVDELKKKLQAQVIILSLHMDFSFASSVFFSFPNQLGYLFTNLMGYVSHDMLVKVHCGNEF